ncbi:hypothetical protein N9N00_02060 [Schleiferiaceae bacterium]|jgi:protein-S-isoprenylcysteine O-methyltransferase Ste14|nr:hypothetical protein [Schleiferiaceae bacterium]
MKNKLGPTLFILGSLGILTSDIFFMNHLMGARNVYWTGFTLSFVGGFLSLWQWFRAKS